MRTLSTGYKSIFKLILALSVNVPYLFLDEPVLGLDANHREMFYRILLEKYIEEPFTIVISTHLIEEVASVIEHVVILKDGKIVKNCATEELLAGGYRISGKKEMVDHMEPGRGCNRHGDARNDEDGICDRKFQEKWRKHGRAGSGEVGLAEDVYPDDKSLEGDVYENEEEF